MRFSTKTVIIVPLCFFLLCSSLAWAGIITGPIVDPANGHSYYLLTPQTWTSSQAEAVTLGGNLATVNNAAENTWIVSTFSNFGGIPRGLWIGLTDAVSEGTFVWASGEPVVYTNWARGEPNNNGGIEDWAEILYPNDTAGRFPHWNDAPDVVNPFAAVTNGVVEVNRLVPEPSGLMLFGLGVAALCFYRRRRDRVPDNSERRLSGREP